MYEVSKERHQFAVALRGTVDRYKNGCHEEHLVILQVILTVGNLLDAGLLTGLHPVIQRSNRRILGMPTHSDMRLRHRDFRRALRNLQRKAKLYPEDPEIVELVYVLEAICRALGISPMRTTLLSDRMTRASVSTFLSQEVARAVEPLMAEAVAQRRRVAA